MGPGDHGRAGGDELSSGWTSVARALRVALVVLVALAAACSDRAAGPAVEAPPRGPIVLVGIDGLDWDVVLPLVAQGKLPALAGLMRRGVFGRLQTFVPTKSPVIWTTIATGLAPAQHGIEDFVRVENGQSRLFTNSDRQAKAFWDILSDAGQTSDVIGWWMTYPVDPIRGVMVAQTNTLAQIDTRYGKGVWKGSLLPGLPGQVHPPEFQAEALEIAGAIDRDLPAVVERTFGTFRHPVHELESRLWNNTLWAFRADRIYFDVTMRLLEHGAPFDLLAVYFGGTDVVGHRFWRYRTPQEFAHPPDAAAIEDFGGIIDHYHEAVDAMVGAILARVPADATVIVVSDHGMHAFNTGEVFDADDPPLNVNSGEHQDAPPGVIIAAGPRVKASSAPIPARGAEVPMRASIYDIAPTLLALSGIAVGRDMQGQVLDALFDLAGQPVTFVESHTTEAWRQGRAVVPEISADEQERLDQLRELGYIR